MEKLKKIVHPKSRYGLGEVQKALREQIADHSRQGLHIDPTLTAELEYALVNAYGSGERAKLFAEKVKKEFGNKKHETDVNADWAIRVSLRQLIERDNGYVADCGEALKSVTSYHDRYQTLWEQEADQHIFEQVEHELSIRSSQLAIMVTIVDEPSPSQTSLQRIHQSLLTEIRWWNNHDKQLRKADPMAELPRLERIIVILEEVYEDWPEHHATQLSEDKLSKFRRLLKKVHQLAEEHYNTVKTDFRSLKGLIRKLEERSETVVKQRQIHAPLLEHFNEDQTMSTHNDQFDDAVREHIDGASELSGITNAAVHLKHLDADYQRFEAIMQNECSTESAKARELLLWGLRRYLVSHPKLDAPAHELKTLVAAETTRHMTDTLRKFYDRYCEKLRHHKPSKKQFDEFFTNENWKSEDTILHVLNEVRSYIERYITPIRQSLNGQGGPDQLPSIESKLARLTNQFPTLISDLREFRYVSGIKHGVHKVVHTLERLERDVEHLKTHYRQLQELLDELFDRVDKLRTLIEAQIRYDGNEVYDAHAKEYKSIQSGFFGPDAMAKVAELAGKSPKSLFESTKNDVEGQSSWLRDLSSYFPTK